MTRKPALVMGTLSRLLLLSGDLLLLAWARTHTLRYKIDVSPKHLPGKHWCMTEGEVDGKTFVSSDCSDAKVRAIGVLGGKVNGTKSWEQQSETLKDLAHELREVLLHAEHENQTSSDSLDLLVQMTCKQNTGGNFTATWDFYLNGRMYLCLDSDFKVWSTVPHEFHGMKIKLKNNKYLHFLYRRTRAECRSWMKEFMEQWMDNVDITGLPRASLFYRSHVVSFLKSFKIISYNNS